MATNSQPAGLRWEMTYQGKTLTDAPHCQRDALIIASSESLQGPDIVPRRAAELTKEDMEILQRLNLSSPEQWKDDTSIVKARLEMDKQYYDTIIVKIEETKQAVLDACETLMRSTTKAGVDIIYFGPGRRNTGDWCFEDGYITFREMVELYLNNFKGRMLDIESDCSHSGYWVKELVKFLEEQGVKPCGHSAREKGLLLNVGASCRSFEIPYHLLYATRAYSNDKNRGTLIGKGSMYKVDKGQQLFSIIPTRIRCGVESIEEPCILSPDQTWQRVLERERLRLMRRRDNRGQPFWYYVLLVDDEEKIKQFEERIVTDGHLCFADYGQVLKSGIGENPPNDIADWFVKRYFF